MLHFKVIFKSWKGPDDTSQVGMNGLIWRHLLSSLFVAAQYCLFAIIMQPCCTHKAVHGARLTIPVHFAIIIKEKLSRATVSPN